MSISLLPANSNVFEEIIYERLYSFFDKKNVLLSKPFGFLCGHSTIAGVTEQIG